ncbi:MAG: CPBP family intramembrane metalloprotease [Gemmatimonadaceae bacterium]|nr:CPBP family intramembrane metalloprotease [Gemmatimonadaceae bacterium]
MHARWRIVRIATREAFLKSASVRVGLFLLAYMLLLWLASIPKGMAPPRFADITWGMTASVAILGMTLLFLRRERRAPHDVGLGVDARTAWRFTGGILLGVTVYGVTLLCISLAVGPLVVASASQPSARVVVLMVCSFIALSSMEELGFRGYPLRTLTTAIGTWRAQVIVAIAFGLSHVAFGWPWQAIVLGVIPSAVLFGTTAIVSGGLAMPIGLHAAVNFAQWAVGEKSSRGFWTVTVDPLLAARAATLAPYIGATVPLLFSAVLWWWHTRHLQRT